MTHSNKLKKVKIMFVIDFIYKTTGGTENQLVKLINNLDSDKYEIYLLSLRNTPWIIENRNKLKSEVKAFNYNVFNHKDLGNIISFFKITKYIKEVNPDILLTYFRTSYILGTFAARLAGIGNIISTRRDYGLWLDDKRYIYILKLANKFVRGIIVNSHAVKELTSRKEKFDDSRIYVIYNGIDIDNFKHNGNSRESLKQKLGIPLNHCVVGIVAGLRPMKRHVTFLKAAERILKEKNNKHFVIVGDGPLRKDLEELSKELGIYEHIHFVGWQRDVISYLSIFDIGVNCSSNEGLSNAIMEYMAYGIPCIVSRAGGNEELIKNGVNGLTFELDNDEHLANMVIMLLENDKMKKEFVESSRKIIENEFSVERMIENYDRLFGSI